MKILITGAKGFVGMNLVTQLKNRQFNDIYEYDKDTDPARLEEYCEEADFVFHLAGANRPNPYGQSKRAGEELLFKYSKETGVKNFVYRFPNIFGKWCKPNYNSAIATFCHNISRNIPITVNDPGVVMHLVYIDDVVNELINTLDSRVNRIGDFCEVPELYSITLGEIVTLLNSFHKSREECSIPNMLDVFTKKLYSTYVSYLPEGQLSYELKMNVDNRGSFTEFIKTPDRGQISVNISKPGIKKGNHWHQTKNEKFLVVSGKGVIRLRKIDSDVTIEYLVSGDKLEVVDIPTGYTHNIENLGDTDMVTIIWVNECYNSEYPDTYYLEVS
ncbi:MAG: capsular biosynthesis protein [Herbinix sp.]|nr:capsular biosynthesis protein [Herbinix sp.]